jgi:hypothetical protein
MIAVELEMYTLEYSDETAAAFFIKIITIHKVI